MSSVLEAYDPATSRTGRAGASARWAVPMLCLSLLLHAGLAWLARPAGIATGQDDTEYIGLAESLRQGGYREVWRVDAPWHAKYPPGYPVLLAGWGGAFGDGYDALVALSVVLSVSALVLVFALVRWCLDARLAALCVLVLALNPALVTTAGRIQSETPYAVFSLTCFLCLAIASRATMRAHADAGADDATVGAAGCDTRARRWPRRGRHATRWLILAGAMAIMAALTRSIGVTLIAAVGLHWLLERRFRGAAILAAASALTVGGWLLWTVRAPEQYVGASYIAEARAFEGTPYLDPPARRVVNNALFYATNAIPHNLAVPTVPGTPIDNVILVGLLAVTGIAGAWVLVRRWRPAVLYLLAYLGLLLVWVWGQDRFVVPILVLIVPVVLVGAASLGRLVRRGWGMPMTLAVAAMLVVGGGLRSAGAVQRQLQCERTNGMPPDQCLRRDQVSYFAALRYIENNLPESAVFLTAKSGALYHYTGRRSIGLNPSVAQPPDSFMPFIRAQGATHILLASLELTEPSRLARQLEANCGVLEVEAFFPARTYLFRVQGEGEGEGVGVGGCVAVAAYGEANRGRDWGRDP